MSTVRRLRPTDGTPIEEAPIWVLAILAALFALVFSPALIGLAESLGADTRGRRLELAGAAGAIAVLVVAGLATRPRWRRATSPFEPDERPLFARFSTWLWTTILFPNLLHGLLVLTREERVDPKAAWLVGLGVSAVQAVWALAHRRRRAG